MASNSELLHLLDQREQLQHFGVELTDIKEKSVDDFFVRNIARGMLPLVRLTYLLNRKELSRRGDFDTLVSSPDIGAILDN